MAEKGKGQGYVYFNNQRKKWNAQYMEYDVKTGISKPKTKSFRTEEEAKKYLATIMYQKENPIFIEHNGIPLVEIMKSNLQLKLATNQIGESQFTRVSDTIKKLGRLSVCQKNIDSITSQEIQAYLNSIKHLSNSSIKKEYEQFNQAFKVAINKGYIMKNPMNDVIKPKSEKENKEVRALTVEEQQEFTNFLTSIDLKQCKYRNIYLIQIYMGLRVGEALALTVHDFDLKHKKANIHRTLTTDGDGNIIMGNKTKTYSGKRIVPIPDFLYPYIVEQMQIADKQKCNEDKLLFKPLYANYTRRKNVNDRLKAILEQNFGITDITTHSLRHTYGTRCIEAGMAPIVVQKLMGHKDVSVTLNTYASVFDKFKENEVDKVNQYYMSENLTLNSSKAKNFIEEDYER